MLFGIMLQPLRESCKLPLSCILYPPPAPRLFQHLCKTKVTSLQNKSMERRENVSEIGWGEANQNQWRIEATKPTKPTHHQTPNPSHINVSVVMASTVAGRKILGLSRTSFFVNEAYGVLISQNMLGLQTVQSRGLLRIFFSSPRVKKYQKIYRQCWDSNPKQSRWWERH